MPFAGCLAGAEAYAVRKQAVRIELRVLIQLRKPTVFTTRKAVSGRPIARGRWESPESETGACFHRGLP